MDIVIGRHNILYESPVPSDLSHAAWKLDIETTSCLVSKRIAIHWLGKVIDN